jgi:signal peptidase I
MNAQSSSMPWYLKMVVGRSPKWTMVRLICIIVGSLILFKGILLPVRVHGISMDPTYPDGKINFINKLAYLRTPPRRGDVVGIRFAGESVMLLKRIIGLPGETIQIRRGVVFIDGEEFQEDYLKLQAKTWFHPPTTLAPDEYFVIGDNRSMAQEDHVHGMVKRFRIVGKVLF